MLYRYFNSGVLIAEFEIMQDEILYRNRNIKTLEWDKKAILCKNTSLPQFQDDISVFDILQKIMRKEYLLSDNYKKYKKVDCTGKNKTEEVWIWAQEKGVYPQDYVIADDEIIGVLRRSSVLVKSGYEDYTPLIDFCNPELSKPVYGIDEIKTYQVRMRDGINLATDVILPAGMKKDEKVPAILIRTCYGKRASMIKEMYVFANYGFAVVSQDVRGREDSEGHWSPCINEIKDGGDTLDWLCQQSWCDGNIGMIGPSYLGLVQWAAAANGNPHLKALISQVSAGTPFFDFPHRNGILVSGTLAWAFAMSEKSFKPELMIRDDWEDVLKIRPLKEIPIQVLGKDVPFLNEWMQHEYENSYWLKGDWELKAENIDVPTLYVSGWYDDVSTGTCQAWSMNQREGRKNQKLVAGPWMHKFNSTREIHNIKFGLNSIKYDLFYQYLRWFDRFLKDIENGIDNEPQVEYYIVGENRWAQSKNWPPEEVEETAFFFWSNGRANTRNGDGKLKLEKPKKQQSDKYYFDPGDAAPHLIYISENECLVPENYKEVENRQDVLVYTSEPLQESFVIAGEPKVILYASSSAKDTDWVVRLTDVDDEGNSIRLCDGVVRAKLRKSFEKPDYLIPYKVEAYNIQMTWISNQFKEGHRVRIEVTSGAKNYIFPNHNTGNDMAVDTEIIVAKQTIFHEEKFPSHLLLPVIKNKK